MSVFKDVSEIAAAATVSNFWNNEDVRIKLVTQQWVKRNMQPKKKTFRR